MNSYERRLNLLPSYRLQRMNVSYARQRMQYSAQYSQDSQRHQPILPQNPSQPPTLQQIVDPENLIRIYNTMACRAGQAPGPDGVRYADLSRREVGPIMKALSREIMAGRFSPSLARHVNVPKPGSRGFRTLSLRSILYRVVAAALADSLGPFWEPMFLDGSHGFRRGRGPLTMLVALEKTMLQQQRFVIAQDDIRKAFDYLPIQTILDHHRRYIQDGALMGLIEKILQGHPAEQRTVGVDQGSAYSPLALNVLLHHVLDIPSEHAGIPPWLRYADNLVYPCQSVSEGQAAIEQARSHLNTLGLTLKGEDGPPVDISRRGNKAQLLGFEAQWHQGRIRYGIPKEAWDRLEAKLREAHRSNNPATTAQEVVGGWIAAGGPAFERQSENAAARRVLYLLTLAGFREIPLDWLRSRVSSAKVRWLSLRVRLQDEPPGDQHGDRRHVDACGSACRDPDRT